VFGGGGGLPFVAEIGEELVVGDLVFGGEDFEVGSVKVVRG
jgi:hypothetical protein